MLIKHLYFFQFNTFRHFSKRTMSSVHINIVLGSFMLQLASICMWCLFPLHPWCFKNQEGQTSPISYGGYSTLVVILESHVSIIIYISPQYPSNDCGLCAVVQFKCIMQGVQALPSVFIKQIIAVIDKGICCSSWRKDRINEDKEACSV